MTARDQLYGALFTSRRAIVESDRMLRGTYKTLNAIDAALTKSRTAIQATRERLAESPPELAGREIPRIHATPRRATSFMIADRG